MKNNITFSAIVSIIITSIGLFINLICSFFFKFAPLTLKIYGGELIEHIGFGINFIKIFVLSPQTESGGISTNIQFDFISLLASFVIIFVVVLIIKTFANKKNK